MVELRTTNDVGSRTLRGAPGTLSTNICAAVRLSLTNKPFPQRALPVTDRWSVGAPINHAVSGFRRGWAHGDSGGDRKSRPPSRFRESRPTTCVDSRRPVHP